MSPKQVENVLNLIQKNFKAWDISMGINNNFYALWNE